MSNWRNDEAKYQVKKAQAAAWARNNRERIKHNERKRRLRAAYVKIAHRCLVEFGELPELGNTVITQVIPPAQANQGVS